jgi:hypothetical protein
MYQTTIYPLYYDVIRETVFEIDASYVDPGYSGRGMYGSRCFSIVTSEPFRVLIEITRALVETFGGEVDELLDDLGYDVRQDSMGRSQVVVYWPHLTVGDARD